MLTQPQIDNYFTKNIHILQNIAKGINFKYNRGIEPDSIVTESYLHCLKNKHKVNNEQDLQRMSIKFIRDNLIWVQSSINKKEGKTTTVTKVDVDEFHYLLSDDEIDHDFEHKLEIERWYNERKSILFLWRTFGITFFYKEKPEDLKRREIIFDVFFNKNKQTGKDIAEHLGIKPYYGRMYKKELELDIKLFNDILKKNNNNMTRLKLKKQYEDVVVTKPHNKLGTLTFDAKKVNVFDYDFYYENGFKELFTRVYHYKGVVQSNICESKVEKDNNKNDKG